MACKGPASHSAGTTALVGLDRDGKHKGPKDHNREGSKKEVLFVFAVVFVSRTTTKTQISRRILSISPLLVGSFYGLVGTR